MMSEGKMVRSILAVALALFLAGPVWANPEPSDGTYFYDLIIDADNDPSTGCTTHVEDDNIDTNLKAEYIVRATVETDTMEVTSVELLACSGMMFVHSSVDDGDWDVGQNNGVDGADVVEAYVPRASIGDPKVIRFAVRATGPTSNSDILLTSNGLTSGVPLVFQLVPSQAAPVVSHLAFAALAFLVFGVGAWRLGRGGSRSLAAVAIVSLLLGAGATAWAVTIALDGAVTDWAGIAPVGTDQTDDSSNDDSGEDIVAAFLTVDGVNLYFRVDVTALEEPS